MVTSRLNRLGHGRQVDIAIGQHVNEVSREAVGGVAGDDVLSEGDPGVALNGDVVVIPDDREIVQRLRAGDG